MSWCAAFAFVYSVYDSLSPGASSRAVVVFVSDTPSACSTVFVVTGNAPGHVIGISHPITIITTIINTSVALPVIIFFLKDRPGARA